MKMSLACALRVHDHCDGSPTNALDDPAFMAGMDINPAEKCGCLCHANT